MTGDTVVVIEQGDTTVVEVQTPGPQGVPGAAGGFTSVNTRTGVVTLTKTDVGLGNVDNTSDASKPVSTATQTAIAGRVPYLTPTATKTASYTAVVGDYVIVDATSGPITITLPLAAANQRIAVKKIDSSANAVTVQRSGSDFLGSLSATSLPLSTQNESATYLGSAGRWHIENGHLSRPSLDARYEPTIAAGTSAQYWRGDKMWVTLDKTSVGLGNVDNTSDLSKPLSTLVQAALNLKADDSLVLHLAGTETVSGTKTFSAIPTFTGGGASRQGILINNGSDHPALRLQGSASTSMISGSFNGASVDISVNNQLTLTRYRLSNSAMTTFADPSTSTTTSYDAPYFTFTNSYWNGTASVNVAATLRFYMTSTAPTSRLALAIAGSEYLSILNTGLVGIGTTSPTHTLTLPSTSTGIVEYNTTDQTTNFERLLIGYQSNVATIQQVSAGTGTNRLLRVQQTNNNGQSVNFDLSRAASAFLNFYYSQTNATGTALIRWADSVIHDATSGTQLIFGISPRFSQSGTAGYTALLVNPTETSVGTGSKLLADFQIGGTSRFKINNVGVVTAAAASNASPAEGDSWNDSTLAAMIDYVGGISVTREGVLYFAKSIVSTGNTTTATSLLSATFRGTKTLPANFLASKGVRIKLKGVYSSDVTTTGVTVPVTLGGTQIAIVNLTALGNAASNKTWTGEVLIRAETTGTTGTVVCTGGASFSTGMTGQAFGDLSNNGATTTINTTVAQAVDITARFNSSVLGQDIKVLSAVIEVVA